MSPRSSASGVGFRSERGPILIAMMVSMALVALDATVLATAVPSIVDDLGGFSQFPWLFSIYLLTQAVSVPVYSKLSDTLGRKPVMLAGIGIFFAGSILAGVAWSMPALIAFRAVQGLGAGAIQPTATTIAGDIYTVAERAKVQGYLSSVWAVASVLGPAVGGLFSQLATWRLVFLINIPVCVLAAFLLIRHYHETPQRQSVNIDYPGAALLTGGLTLTVLGVLEGGQAWAWTSTMGIGSFVLGSMCLIAFVLVERHTTNPVLPLWVFSDRLLLTTTLVSLGVGTVLIGLSSYVPTFLERAAASVPLVAGLAVAAQSIGWPIASSVSGRIYLRFGYRATTVLGAGVLIVGTTGLTLIASLASPWFTALCCFVIGAGLGFCATPAIVAAQSSVDRSRRGVVTGANMLARTLGSAVGVAVFGAVANAIINSSTGDANDPSVIVSSSRGVFGAVLICAVLTLAAAAAIPRTARARPSVR